jgi:hypothetical protein
MVSGLSGDGKRATGRVNWDALLEVIEASLPKIRPVYSGEDGKGVDRYERADSLGKNLQGEGARCSQLVSTSS